MQTRKVTRFPVILMGTEYWSGLINWIRDRMVAEGTVSPGDLDLITVTDDVAEAVAIIQAADATRAEHESEPPPGEAVPDSAPVPGSAPVDD